LNNEKSKKILELIDGLLCAGYDNSEIVVITKDRNDKMGLYFGIGGKDALQHVRRGICVYGMDDRNNFVEYEFKPDNVYSTVYDNTTISYFAI
jgi:hypothetical protein